MPADERTTFRMTDVVEPACTIDPMLFRRVMGRFATGVTVVSFLRGGKPAGITVNAFLSVSLDPPLVLVSVRKRSSFIEYVQIGSRCGVNILSEQQHTLGPYFANQRARSVDVRFRSHAGTPLLEGSLAHIVVRIVDIRPAGDHFLFIAQIEHLEHGPDAQPLIFFSGHYKRIHAYDPQTTAPNHVPGRRTDMRSRRAEGNHGGPG